MDQGKLRIRLGFVAMQQVEIDVSASGFQNELAKVTKPHGDKGLLTCVRLQPPAWAGLALITLLVSRPQAARDHPQLNQSRRLQFLFRSLIPLHPRMMNQAPVHKQEMRAAGPAAKKRGGLQRDDPYPVSVPGHGWDKSRGGHAKVCD